MISSTSKENMVKENHIDFQPFFPELAPRLSLPGEITVDNKERLIEEFANNLAQATNQSLPVNIDSFTNYFRIAKISKFTHKHAQGLAWSIESLPQNFPSYWHVEIQEPLPQDEERFTLVHEMAHILLKDNKSLVLENAARTEIEELADRIGRSIIAPEALLVPEYNELESDDSLVKIALLYEKTRMPAYQLVKRLKKDLRLLNEEFIVWSLSQVQRGNHFVEEGDWVISEDPDFNTGEDGMYADTKKRRFSPFIHHNNFTFAISAKENEPSNVRKAIALTRNRQKEGWTQVWLTEVKGIGLGREERGYAPEYVVCKIKKLSKIADVQSLNYINPTLLSSSDTFYFTS